MQLKISKNEQSKSAFCTKSNCTFTFRWSKNSVIWLSFAKNQGGDFVLRIEDTDTARYVEGEEYIMKALEWCGIIPDESPIHGGNYNHIDNQKEEIFTTNTPQKSWKQIMRISLWHSWRIRKVRAEYEAKGEVFSYNNFTRNSMRNSLTLSEQETQELINQERSLRSKI